MRVAVALLTSPVVTPSNVDAAKDVVIRELRQRTSDPRAAVQDALNDVVLPKDLSSACCGMVFDYGAQPPPEPSQADIFDALLSAPSD